MSTLTIKVPVVPLVVGGLCALAVAYMPKNMTAEDWRKVFEAMGKKNEPKKPTSNEDVPAVPI